MKLSSVKQCHVCSGTHLTPIDNIPIVDMFTDEEIPRVILFCEDCETMHFVDNGQIVYEFSCKISNKVFNRELKIND